MRTARAMRDLVAILRANNPRMIVVIRGFAGSDPRSEGLTRQYRKMATELTTPDSSVVISMPSPGWQWDPKHPDTDTVDGCHPNPRGDAKIATDFFAALKPLLIDVDRKPRNGDGPASADYVWLEGEKPAAMPAGMQVASAALPHFLSGRQWLSFIAEAGEVDKKVPAEGLTISYPFALRRGGGQQVWARIGYEFARAPLEWRIDGTAWKKVSPDDLTTDLMELSRFCEVAWLKLADVSLLAGQHTLEIHLPRFKNSRGENQRMLFALDALCISAGEFVPHGPDRPGEVSRTEKDEQAAKHVFRLPEMETSAARSSVKLAGLWEVCRHDEQLPTEVAAPIRDFPTHPFWTAIEVPGDKNTREDLVFAHRLWYRTRVAVPASHAGRSFHIVFPANSLHVELLVLARRDLVLGRLCGDGLTVESQGPGVGERIGGVGTVENAEVPAGKEQMLDFAAKWENPRLWWPDEPNLYRLRTTMKLAGKPVDVKETLFGFREWTIDGIHLRLNGVKWQGFSEQGPGGDTLPDLIAIMKDPKRNYGFLRTFSAHDGQIDVLGKAPEEFLTTMDRAGVLIRRTGYLDGEAIGYMPSVLKPLAPNWYDHLTAWIKGERNHPSIMLGSVENELNFINARNMDQLNVWEPILTHAREVVRKADPTRPMMIDGGGATRANTRAIHGDHYSTKPFWNYPQLAYEANARSPCGNWTWDQKRPKFIGEELFAAGINPAYAYFGGEAVFQGKAASRAAVGKAMQVISQGYRWFGITGCDFCQSSSDADGSQYNGWAPRAVLVRQWDWTFVAGQKGARGGLRAPAGQAPRPGRTGRKRHVCLRPAGFDVGGAQGQRHPLHDSEHARAAARGRKGVAGRQRRLDGRREHHRRAGSLRGHRRAGPCPGTGASPALPGLEPGRDRDGN